MVMPTVAVVTTNLDAAGDSPATARADLLDAVTKLNQIIAHISTFAGTLLDDSTANSMLTTLGAASVTNGFRENYIDNGGCTVQQVSGTTLTATAAYGNVDRFLVAALSGTAISGTNGAGTATSFATGLGVGAVSATFTTGQMVIRHRIESARTKQLNNKYVTVSCRVWHDFGSTRNVTLQVKKCNTFNSWVGGFTTLATSSSTACASGAYTTVSVTVAGMGATGGDNGLEIELLDGATATVASKSFIASEWQMEVGASATAFVAEDYATALLKCQRYYELIGAGASNSILVYGGYASVVGEVVYLMVPFKAEKWKDPPSVTKQGTWPFFNATVLTIDNVDPDHCFLSTAATASGSSWYCANSGTSSHLRVDARP